MKRTYASCILAGMCLVCICQAARAQTLAWPQFRGVNCSGIAAKQEKPPLEFSEKNLLWKTDLPAGHSSPVVWEDRIFVSGCVAEEKKLEVLCLNRLNGQILWQHELFPEEIEKLHAVGNAAQSSPVTDGERVYFYFGSYGLQCYEVSGRFLWERKFPLTKAHYGVASSPIMYENMVLICRDVYSEEKIYALDKYTGDPIWTADLPERAEKWKYPSYSTPVIWKGNIVTHRCMFSTAHSLKNGSLVWWMEIPSGGTSTPVVNGDMIYFGAWHEVSEEEQRGELPPFDTMIARYDSNRDGAISRQEIPEDMVFFQRPEIMELQGPIYLRNFFGGYDTNKDGICDREEWDSRSAFWRSYFVDGGLFAIRPEGTEELSPESMVWKVNEKVPEAPSPLYYKGLVYMCKNGGILTCMDGEAGTVLYRERIGAPGAYFASPVAANGYIYIPSGKGIVTVLRAGRQLEIAAQSRLNDDFFATPVIVDNHMYFRGRRSLYAYGD
jgi:outer membrane protein assembly factor BamB